MFTPARTVINPFQSFQEDQLHNSTRGIDYVLADPNGKDPIDLGPPLLLRQYAKAKIISYGGFDPCREALTYVEN